MSDKLQNPSTVVCDFQQNVTTATTLSLNELCLIRNYMYSAPVVPRQETFLAPPLVSGDPTVCYKIRVTVNSCH